MRYLYHLFFALIVMSVGIIVATISMTERPDFIVYKYECWSGSAQVFDKVLLEGPHGWESLDETSVPTIVGNAVCIKTPIGKRTRKQYYAEKETS